MFRVDGRVKKNMSIETMRTRLSFGGGAHQQDRMIKDKERSLKKALLYSYQAATAVLKDGREFRCLINPDKTKMDYDTKILSIPFKDVCLNGRMLGTTTEGEEVVGMKGGEVFYWKETDSYWITYLQMKEELAYFRAEIRRCDYTMTINGHEYRIYVRGPVETKIPWNQKKGIVWNDINYTLNVLITKNKETLDFFHRFTKVKIADKTWEVQVVDSLDGDGIIELALKEDFTNEFGPDLEAAMPKVEIDRTEKGQPHILGDAIVYPFDEKTYYIKDAEDGEWIINNEKAIKVIDSDSTFISLEIKSKPGEFDLIYKRENEDDIIKNIKIDSL